MNLKDYLNTKELAGKVPGFPEGDTFINLDEVSAEDFSFDDDNGKKITKTKLKFKDGKEHYCPDSVLRKIEELMTQGLKKVRVTRTGTTFDNTKYTVIGIKEEA